MIAAVRSHDDPPRFWRDPVKCASCQRSVSRTVTPSFSVPWARAARLTELGTGFGSTMPPRRSTSDCIGRVVTCPRRLFTGLGATPVDSSGGQTRFSSCDAATSGSSSIRGRATAREAPTVSFQFGIVIPVFSSRDGIRPASGLPVRTDTNSIAAPRPSRARSRTGCGSSVVPSGVMKMRTPFSAARRGDGRSHDREKSSAIFPFAIRAMRWDVTASSAGMSLAPPTIETWPSHWIPSASNGCQIWKEGRSTTGSGLLELSGRRDMFERSSPD